MEVDKPNTHVVRSFTDLELYAVREANGVCFADMVPATSLETKPLPNKFGGSKAHINIGILHVGSKAGDSRNHCLYDPCVYVVVGPLKLQVPEALSALASCVYWVHYMAGQLSHQETTVLLH